MRRLIDPLAHAAIAIVVQLPLVPIINPTPWAILLLAMSAAGTMTLREIAQHRRPGMVVGDIIREINPVDIAEGSIGGALLGLAIWYFG